MFTIVTFCNGLISKIQNTILLEVFIRLFQVIQINKVEDDNSILFCNSRIHLAIVVYQKYELLEQA